MSQADDRHGNAQRPALDQTVPGSGYRDLAAIHQHLTNRKSTALPDWVVKRRRSRFQVCRKRLRWDAGLLRLEHFAQQLKRQTVTWTRSAPTRTKLGVAEDITGLQRPLRADKLAAQQDRGALAAHDEPDQSLWRRPQHRPAEAFGEGFDERAIVDDARRDRIAEAARRSVIDHMEQYRRPCRRHAPRAAFASLLPMTQPSPRQNGNRMIGRKPRARPTCHKRPRCDLRSTLPSTTPICSFAWRIRLASTPSAAASHWLTSSAGKSSPIGFESSSEFGHELRQR